MTDRINELRIQRGVIELKADDGDRGVFDSVVPEDGVTGGD